MRQVVGPRQHQKTVIGKTPATVKNLTIFARFPQPSDPGEKEPRSAWQYRWSGRQPGTALRPSRFQYLAAIAGRHTGPKAMGTCLLQIAGLKGSLHS